MVDTSDSGIAVVGAGCVLPGAADPVSFWTRIVQGTSALSPHSDADPRLAPILGLSQYAEMRHLPVGRIEDFVFDWRQFRMPPRDAERINPIQLMVLQAGAQALAGIRTLPRARTGLFLGATGLGWQADSGLRIRLAQMTSAARAAAATAGLSSDLVDDVIARLTAELDGALQPVTEDNVVGASASVGLGRIASHFDLQGPHYSVDSGYASSLAALDVAVRALRDGEVDMAVAGGASELLTPLELLAFQQMGALSSTALTPFDKSADGTLLSEGCALFALKRVDDALRDDDTIFAVVRGCGGATDVAGRSVLAPDAAGQERALRAALADGDVDPATVGFVECHATGTPLGDATELQALNAVYGDVDAPVQLGGAKAVFGHLRGAAGAVGLLKAVWAVHHGVWPAQPAFAEAAAGAPHVDGGGLKVSSTQMPLTARGDAPGARVGVTAVGFGGTTFHTVVEGVDTWRATSKASRRRSPGSSSTTSTNAPEPIAIVAMGGRFPGANSPAALKAFIEQGGDATQEIPPERWDVDVFYDDDASRADTCYTKLGCFLDALPDDVAPHWRILPSALPVTDPCQLLALQAADQALDGLDDVVDGWDKNRVGVMLAFLPYQGRKFLADARVNSERVWTALQRHLVDAGVPDVDDVIAQARTTFTADLPELTEDSLTGWQGGLCAGRISRAHGFGGPHLVTDSACASTHAALHAAVQALRHQTCDAVLAGGVWADMMPEFFVAACRFNALSATGSTPFDVDADGFVPGEGAGVFVLRRLSDALAHDEPVLAVLRSVTGSSDGRGSSVLAPTQAGEALAMSRALEQAGLRSDDVDYVECHGTGTALGDVVEAHAVAEAYRGRTTPLPLGSVKSNIGHLNAAAGVPALMKAVWAVQDGVVAPSIKVERENPALELQGNTPLAIAKDATSLASPPHRPRRVGVSGFGVGGSNMHLVVEAHVPTPAVAQSVESVMSAEMHPALPESSMAPSTRSAVDVATGANVADALSRLHPAHTHDEGDAGKVRLAIASHDDGERQRGLRLLQASTPPSLSTLAAQGVFVGNAEERCGVVAMFPGQGPHYPGMLSTLAQHEHDVMRTVEEADAIYQTLTGRPLSPSFWPSSTTSAPQNDEDIHCATLVVNVALFRALAARGFKPDLVLGQSAGELSALVAAGALELRDGLALMRARTLAVLSVPAARAGRMLALPLGAQDVAPTLPALEGFAVIAADNGPSACLVSADDQGADAVLTWAASRGVEAKTLAVSHGYHSELIADAVRPYREALGSVEFRAPSTPVASTITGAELTRFDLERLPDLLAEQLVRPVRLADAVRAAAMRGASLFVECGPKRALSTFVDAILDDKPVLAVSTLHPKVGEVNQFLRAWSSLWVRGRAAVPSTASETPAAVVSAQTEVDAALAHLRAALQATRNRDEAAQLLVRVQQDLVQLTISLDDVLGAPATTPPVSTRPPVAALSTTSAGEVAAADAAPPDVQTPVGFSHPRYDDVVAMLVSDLVERTGYPVDMIDVDLDLEADLGIDTVKQVAAFAAVREALQLGVDDAFKLRDHPTVRLVAESLCRRLSPPPTTTSTVSESLSTSSPSPLGSSDDTIHDLLVASLVAKTGYPPDMLDDHLDLEADLGIDTVKQVAAYADVREQLGLDVEEGFRLRDFPTLGAVVQHFKRRVAAPTSSTALMPSPAVAPSLQMQTPAHTALATRHVGDVKATVDARLDDDVRALLVTSLVAKTGYPPDMLEDHLDLEADLGIDTVKQVAAYADVRERLGLEVEDGFRLRDFPTLGAVVQHFQQRLTAPASTPLDASTLDVGESTSHVVLENGDFADCVLQLLPDVDDDSRGRGLRTVLAESTASPGGAELRRTSSEVSLWQDDVCVGRASPSDTPSTTPSRLPSTTPATTTLPARAAEVLKTLWSSSTTSLVSMQQTGGHVWEAVVDGVDGLASSVRATAAAFNVVHFAVGGTRVRLTTLTQLQVWGTPRPGPVQVRVELRPSPQGTWEGRCVVDDGAGFCLWLDGMQGPRVSGDGGLNDDAWKLLQFELNQP